MPRHRLSWGFPARTAVLAMTALVVLAGCGSGEDSAEVASLGKAGETGATESEPVDRERALTDYARCMRENGVADFPDPTVESDGTVRLAGMRELDRSDPVVANAIEECDPLLQSVRQDYTPEQQQDREDALLAYARCMRENGYQMDDPDLSSMGPGSGGVFRDLDRNDPAFQQADDVCRPQTLGDGGMGLGGGQGGSGS